VLSYWTVETLGDLQSTSKGLDVLTLSAYRIHTIPILMHQMRISTASSVILRPRKILEIQNDLTVENPKKNSMSRVDLSTISESSMRG
jgi:hypothetical protein